MSRKSNGLGRGLEDLGLHELISGMQKSVPVAKREAINSTEGLHYLPLNRLEPGKFQPRTCIDDSSLLELSQSIRSHGVIQPIIARPLNDSSFEIVAGERRWRAAKLANLQTVPVIIKSMADQFSAAVALIENIQREDLNIIDEAQGLVQLMKQFNLTHQSLAQIVGKSRAAVTNTIRVLEADAVVHEALKNKQLSMGHARALLSLSSENQVKVTEQIINRDLSVRATESIVKKETVTKVVDLKKPIRYTTKEQELSKKLHTDVVIKSNAAGVGQIQIKFCSKSHLEAIFKLLDSNAIV
jgi:ParB family chromosome partitioning protein